MERRDNENEIRGIPTVRLNDERTVLGDGRNLIFFDFDITWPEDENQDSFDIEAIGHV